MAGLTGDQARPIDLPPNNERTKNNIGEIVKKITKSLALGDGPCKVGVGSVHDQRGFGQDSHHAKATGTQLLVYVTRLEI